MPRKEVIRKGLIRFYNRFNKLLLLGAVILIVVVAILLYDAIKPSANILTQEDMGEAIEQAVGWVVSRPSNASIAYSVVRPSVVGVQAYLLHEGEKIEIAFGTGVVIEDSGIILTSLHIIQGASEVSVFFQDGFESGAEVVAAQPEKDLAVLQALIIPDDLMPATMASSAGLRVGDEVVAVGNPFGIINSTSAGVVSGLRRNYMSQETGESYTDLIQFDAAVNPGNSGGPLVNRNGEVVGIVTALLNPAGQDFFIGIGFAVPIETAAGGAGSSPF